MTTNRPIEYEGIPVYLRFSDVNRELAEHPKEKNAVDIAKANGWRCALETLYDPGMVAYSAAKSRLKILDLLPLSKDMNVLEIGVGFGQQTVEIASRVKQLDALEVRLVNSLFARIRCEQEGVENVTFICGGDDCFLPFQTASYDAVVLNLVLEWCAGHNSEEPSITRQRRLLSEIRRVLRSKGNLLLNTKNRFSCRLLIGGRDEHAYDLPFGSALPRFLLRLILKLQHRGLPPGYLHSYRSLKRLISDAGLVPAKSYWAVPEMRFPEHFIPIDTRTVRKARRHLARQGDTRATNMLLRATPAYMIKYFTPGLLFVSQKN